MVKFSNSQQSVSGGANATGSRGGAEVSMTITGATLIEVSSGVVPKVKGDPLGALVPGVEPPGVLAGGEETCPGAQFAKTLTVRNTNRKLKRKRVEKILLWRDFSMSAQ